MDVSSTFIEGLLVIRPNIFPDDRGLFFESFHESRYREIGIDYPFVQDNFSHSKKGVLRGMHFQKAQPQGKLVSVVNGEVFDVAVDLRPESTTFGKYYSIHLTSSERNQLWMPPGFAHGFCVLSDEVDLIYKCTDFYSPSDEVGLMWNDPALNIDWPISNPIISEKDENNLGFEDYRNRIGVD